MESSLKKSSGSSESDEEILKKDESDLLETTKSKSKSRKRKLGKTAEGMAFIRPRPNFFLAFQVYNVKIHANVRKLQEQIIVKNPLLYSALISVPTLHVTLAVTHLAAQTDIETLKAKLDEWASENTKEFSTQPIALDFTGVKTFKNLVAYVDIEKNENYEKLSTLLQSVNELLSSAGFSTDEKSSVPHLTVLKLSKNPKLFKKRKQFKNDFKALQENQEHFGIQEISHIQLLAMDEPKDENGYYKCHHLIKFSDINLDMDHSICCSPIPKPIET